MIPAAAWTDVVLALAAFGAALWARPGERWMAPVGLVLVGIAAAVGSVRLGGFEALAPVHSGLSRLAGIAGIPLAGAGVIGNGLGREGRLRLSRVALMLAVGFGILGFTLDDAVFGMLRTAATGGVMLATIGFSIRARSAPGIAGPVLVLVAGLGVAGPGEWAGFDRTGWFHLVMAVAMVAFGQAARPEDE